MFADHVLSLVDAPDPPRTFEVPHGDRIFSLDARAGSWVLSETDDGTVKLWDVADPRTPPRALVELEEDERPWRSLTVSPEGRGLATATRTGHLRVVRLDSPETCLLDRPDARASCLAFARDGAVLATSSTLGGLVVWSLDHPEGLRIILQEDNLHVSVVRFVGDGRSRASASLP